MADVLARRRYEERWGSIMHVRTRRNSFAQLVGEHAVHMVDLTRARDTRSHMAVWGRVARVNAEWGGLMCCDAHPEDEEFARVAHELVERYSDALGDYIVARNAGEPLSRKWHRNVDELVALEARFYAALAQLHTSEERSVMQRCWTAYTNAVVAAANAKGKDYDAAAHALLAGQLLGEYLDRVVR